MIPPEIVDLVFSFLEADPFTLQKCVQCHPEISKIAERHLYANITILDSKSSRDHPQIMPSSTLVQLLSHSPYIANYVRSLTIMLTRGPSLGSQLDPEVASVLRDKLRLLEKFGLTSNLNYMYRIPWSGVHGNVQAALLTFLRLPTLKEVSISRIAHFPLSLLDECRNVTRVLLQDNFCHLDYKVVRPSYPPLDFLSLQDCCPTVIPWIRSHTPRSLDFRVDDPYTFQKILQVCSDTLTNLNVDLWHRACAFFSPLSLAVLCSSVSVATEYDLMQGTTSSPINPSFNLGPLSSLQQLNIHTFMWFETDSFVNSIGCDTFEQRYYSSLPAIVQALQTLPPSSCPLKVVTLHFEILVTSDFNLLQINWSPLFSPWLFNIVHKIDLRIRATRKTLLVPPLTVIASLTVNAQLMRLVEQRLLTVKVEGVGGYVRLPV